jgi:hypothetical protein
MLPVVETTVRDWALAEDAMMSAAQERTSERIFSKWVGGTEKLLPAPKVRNPDQLAAGSLQPRCRLFSASCQLQAVI